MWKSANRLYFESKLESQMNQNMNIEGETKRYGDNYYTV